MSIVRKIKEFQLYLSGFTAYCNGIDKSRYDDLCERLDAILDEAYIIEDEVKVEPVDIKLKIQGLKSDIFNKDSIPIEDAKWLGDELDEIIKLTKQNKTMPISLTTENGAKELLIGEFTEIYEEYEENEDGWSEPYDIYVPVTWHTIKNIYDKIVKHYAK